MTTLSRLAFTGALTDTRERRLAATLTEARAYLDQQLGVEIDSNTIVCGPGVSREAKRAAAVIDEYGGGEIPKLEALIARIDAALVTDGGE